MAALEPTGHHVKTKVRLCPEEIAAIKEVVAAVLGPRAQVWLFGSRADPALKGGDIDLYIETDECLSHPAAVDAQIYAMLIKRLGERKIDLVLRHAASPPALIFAEAKRTGVRL